MSDRPIAFDLSRLVTRMAHSTPTGIDRVDLAYARWLLGAAGAHFAVVSSPIGLRVLRPSSVTAILSTLERQWSDDGRPEADPVYRAVAARLGLRPGSADMRRSPPPHERPFRLRASALAMSRGVDGLPKNALYLHTSHLRLDRPQRFAWLGRRPDVRALFFVHDLIPIDYPEFSRPGEDERHRMRLDTIARRGHGVVVNSAEVKRSLTSHWARTGGPSLPIAVAPLGIEPSFLRDATGGAEAAPFFLMCGTIEPRKNHALLLQVWRRLAGGDDPVPKLVIAGRRGWESEGVIDILERAPFVRDHVIEVSGLSTPALARLMARARAVLMPSFAEGYGLPVVEALSLGTPVVASDIAVHREVARDHAVFLDPLDGPGWTAAVRALAAAPHRPQPRGASPYRPPTWAAHFALAAGALSAVSA